MLKDYYKIFGVKEDASEQEIRARWIELMRHYHPDVQKGMEFAELSKEINEAYEILKDPFTRADYDHNLAQHRCYGGKRVSYRVGFIFLGSILIIAIIYMVITPSKTFIPSVSQPIRRTIAQPQIGKDASKAEDEVKDKVNVEKGQPGPINPSNPINSINQRKVEVKVNENSINSSNPSNPSNPTNPITQAKVEAEAKVEKTSVNPSNPVTQVKVEDKVKVKQSQPNPVTKVKSKVEVKEDQQKRVNPTGPSNSINQAKVEVKNNQTNLTNQTNQITRTEVKQRQPNQINQTNKTDQRNQISSPIAKEEEVKKFFANYVGRYNRKDLVGFMSFFSNRAIQNQKDGLEGIKKIYFTFFNQSLELKYRLSDLKIEMYQNAINVKAQYELDQLSKNGRQNAFKGSIQWILAREGEGLKIVSLDYQQTKGESREI